jgi:tetraacyldisaccharide 4'-kinase
LRGLTVHAVAGIGNPQRFFDLLREHGVQPIGHGFADHYSYAPADLDFAGDQQIVMTEKDAVKCRAFATSRMWYLPVSAHIPDVDAARLLGAVRVCLSRGERRSA